MNKKYKEEQSTRNNENQLASKASTQNTSTAGGKVSTFDWLAKQQTKVNSPWQEEAKKAQDAKELKECTFAPQLI